MPHLEVVGLEVHGPWLAAVRQPLPLRRLARAACPRAARHGRLLLVLLLLVLIQRLLVHQLLLLKAVARRLGLLPNLLRIHMGVGSGIAATRCRLLR